jgi:hypothetical protein
MRPFACLSAISISRAVVQGEIGDGRDIPTRLHQIDIIADVIAGGDSIRKTFASFKKNGRGVFIFLRDGARRASWLISPAWRGPIPKPNAL